MLTDILAFASHSWLVVLIEGIAALGMCVKLYKVAYNSNLTTTKKVN